MPTENRSSNTDPRDVFIRLNPLGLGEEELRKDSSGFEDQRTHSDYLLFLAGYCETHAEPQHHPEPIAWMVGTAFWWTKEEAERDAAAMNLPVIGLGPMNGAAPAEQHHGEPVAWVRFRNGEPDYDGDAVMIMNVPGDTFGDGDSWEPVYTHADPGEVERLTEQLEVANQAITYAAQQGKEKQKTIDALMADAKQFRGERDTLRAQLAERDALLRKASTDLEYIQKECAGDVTPGYIGCLVDDVVNLLSASAEPNAPGVLPRAHDVNMFQRTAEPGAKS